MAQVKVTFFGSHNIFDEKNILTTFLNALHFRHHFRCLHRVHFYSMPSRNLFVSLAVAILAIASAVFAVISWGRVIQLSLPLPIYLPTLNVLFTVLAVITVAISRQLVSKFQKQAIKALLPYLVHGSTLALFALFILSLVYTIPSDIQSCAADRQWLRMFENKAEIAVRRIQSRLQCCGYNSMHDRAWPFPSRDVDARTCERTQGYYIACGGLWRQEQQFGAAMCAAAGFLNWVLVVIIHHALLGLIRREDDALTSEQMLLVNYFPQDEGGRLRLPRWWTNAEPARLTAGGSTESEPERGRVEQERAGL